MSRYINSLIKMVVINENLFKRFDLEGPKDRLGDLCFIHLEKVPNQELLVSCVADFIFNIINLMGYTITKYHKKIFLSEGSVETGDTWIFYVPDKNYIKITHKYWTYKKCCTFATIIEEVCHLHNIKITNHKLKKDKP